MDIQSKQKLLQGYYVCMKHRDRISSLLGNIGRAIADEDPLAEIYERGFNLHIEDTQLAISIENFLLDIKNLENNLSEGDSLK